MRVFALLCAALLLTACFGNGDDDTAPEPTATPANTLPAMSSPEATASPTPPPRPTATATPDLRRAAELPTPTWSTPDHAFLENGGLHNDVILDTATGELIALSEEPVSDFGEAALHVLGWGPGNLMAIGPVRYGFDREDFGGVLVGPPGGPWQPIQLEPFVYAGHAEFSADGASLTVYVQESRAPASYDVDLATRRAVTHGAGANLAAGTSHDGAYRLRVTHRSTSDGLENQFEIDNVATGERVEFVASSGRWSPAANLFAYTHAVAGEPERSVVTLLDLDAGTQVDLGEGRILHSWSPDGRYLAVWLTEGLEEVAVMNVERPENRLHMTGAWPRGWLADGSLLYTKNICGDFDLYAIRPDGSNDRPIVTGRRGAGLTATAAPTGDRIVYRTFGEDPMLYVHLLDGSPEISVETGLFSPPYGYWTEGNWSPDGRYTVISTIPGKDGPCMLETEPRPTTIEVFP